MFLHRKAQMQRGKQDAEEKRPRRLAFEAA